MITLISGIRYFKNVIQLLKYSIQYYCIYLCFYSSDTSVSEHKTDIRSWIRVDLPSYPEGGCMIPVDLLETAMGRSMIQTSDLIYRIRSANPFAESRSMSNEHV